jgi:hypothetical protein
MVPKRSRVCISKGTGKAETSVKKITATDSQRHFQLISAASKRSQKPNQRFEIIGIMYIII